MKSKDQKEYFQNFLLHLTSLFAATLIFVSTARAQSAGSPAFGDIFTGAGELITSNSTKNPARIPAGTAGQALAVGSNGYPTFSGTGVLLEATGLTPATDGDNATSNLGTSSKGWKNIYLSDGTRRSQILQSTGLYIDAPSGQSTFFRVGGSDQWTINGSGNLIGLGTGSAGWAVVDGTDNTACTSQCTAPAVFGFNLAAGATAPVLVGPSDATADICMCAGAS